MQLPRGIIRVLNGLGMCVIPRIPDCPGSASPSGSRKEKFCSMMVKKRKSSTRASDSPKHTRLPDTEYYHISISATRNNVKYCTVWIV